MKKILILFTCLFAFSTIIFAQESDTQEIPIAGAAYDSEQFEAEKTKTEIIIPENQHTTDSTATVRIEYMPMYDEIRIYYECMYVTYDKGEAMNTVLACLEDFQLEHKYFRYKYLRDDKERFFKDDRGRRKAQYISHLQFER